MIGHRGIWHRGWKAVTEHDQGTPYEKDTWRLYDTATDFSESHDVATRHPQRLAALQELWWHAPTTCYRSTTAHSSNFRECAPQTD
ncbi:hypothetical protein [Streptomyces sp. CA-106131]|uniref:hypothetical protein n=1 Tax=Streptomyces sp. CA-106131 TaxID=3240045 RepID=UPI003D8D8254